MPICKSKLASHPPNRKMIKPNKHELTGYLDTNNIQHMLAILSFPAIIMILHGVVLSILIEPIGPHTRRIRAPESVTPNVRLNAPHDHRDVNLWILTVFSLAHILPLKLGHPHIPPVWLSFPSVSAINASLGSRFSANKDSTTTVHALILERSTHTKTYYYFHHLFFWYILLPSPLNTPSMLNIKSFWLSF